MDEFIAAAKALSDPGRVRALMLLRSGELCLCQIMEILELAPSTVSKHMSILKQAGLVESRKEERWNYFRLPETVNTTPIAKLLTLAITTLADDGTIQNDAKNLDKVLKITPLELCRKQKDF